MPAKDSNKDFFGMNWDDDGGYGTTNLSPNQSLKTIHPMTRQISVVYGKYNKLSR